MFGNELSIRQQNCMLTHASSKKHIWTDGSKLTFDHFTEKVWKSKINMMLGWIFTIKIQDFHLKTQYNGHSNLVLLLWRISSPFFIGDPFSCRLSSRTSSSVGILNAQELPTRQKKTKTKNFSMLSFSSSLKASSNFTRKFSLRWVSVNCNNLIDDALFILCQWLWTLAIVLASKIQAFPTTKLAWICKT